MNNTGEQLHPNWRALTTVHIPLKRFIKEGTKNVQMGSRISHGKSYISAVQGDKIREFYDELVTTANKEQDGNFMDSQNNLANKDSKQQKRLKTEFQTRNYFRFAMENEVNGLKNMELEGQNLNVCDYYGWSALMMASCEGAYEVVHFLLALGVDRFIKDKNGRSARDLAHSKGHHKIVELLGKSHSKLKESEQHEQIEKQDPFYCDICKQNFKETSVGQHLTSTIHQFNNKSNLPPNKLHKFNISSRNKGLKMMVKQGWDKESGLGPSQSGRLYPVKTVLRKQRTGLGIEQEAARVTHFKSYDCKAVQRSCSDYRKKNQRSRNDISREKLREWKRDRRLRNDLN